VTYVLDTNAVSALMKGNQAFVNRLASYSPADVTIPQPVIAELRTASSGSLVRDVDLRSRLALN